jgi:hypothetical protein
MSVDNSGGESGIVQEGKRESRKKEEGKERERQRMMLER